MKIKLLSEGAKMPKRADELAAGLDLYTPNNITIHPGRQIIPLDIQMELHPGYEGNMRPRSGFSAKGMEGIGQDGKIGRFEADVIQGTIDASYRGNVGVIINSYDQVPFEIPAGTRIAQIVISQCWMGEFEEADSLNETKRGEGGFGHSGSK